MEPYEQELMLAGVMARLTVIRDELAKICAISPDAQKLAYKQIKALFIGVNSGHGGARVKGARTSLVKSLEEARATRQPKPEPEKKPARKAWTPAMRKAAAKRMRSFWKAAKHAGTTLNDGFKPSRLPGYSATGIKGVNGSHEKRKKVKPIPKLGEPIHVEQPNV